MQIYRITSERSPILNDLIIAYPHMKARRFEKKSSTSTRYHLHEAHSLQPTRLPAWWRVDLARGRGLELDHVARVMAQAFQGREGGELDHGRGPAKENKRVGRGGGQVLGAHLGVDEALAVLPALARLVKSEPKMEVLVHLRQLLRFCVCVVN